MQVYFLNIYCVASGFCASGRLASSDSDKDDLEGSFPPSKPNSRSQSKQDFHSTGGGSSILDQSVKDLLITARNILELGLKNVSFARQVVALNDGKSIADITWSKVCVLLHVHPFCIQWGYIHVMIG